LRTIEDIKEHLKQYKELKAEYQKEWDEKEAIRNAMDDRLGSLHFQIMDANKEIKALRRELKDRKK